jgi:type IV pilus assembly protein PilO
MKLFDKINREKFYPMLYWSPSFKSLVVFGSGFLLLIGSYLFLLKDNLDILTILKQKRTELKLEFEHKQGKALNINHYTEQLATLRGMYKEHEDMLPKLSPSNKLLGDISKLGQQRGLIFSLFDPMEVVDKDLYMELPIKISILGKYEDIVQFLNELSMLKQIITIDNLEIKTTIPSTPLSNSNAAEQGLIQTHALQVDMIAKTYYLNGKNG